MGVRFSAGCPCSFHQTIPQAGVIQMQRWCVLQSNEMIGLERFRNKLGWFGLGNLKDFEKGSYPTMHTNRSFLRIAGRAAAFTFLMAGAASLMQAQQAVSAPAAAPAPLLLAATTSPATFSLAPDAFSSSGSSSSSSLSSDSSDALAASSSSFSSDLSQPPPRRRYGRPNYADSHTNPDGSSKFAFMATGSCPTRASQKFRESLPLGVFR